jgi:hypothetical protein
MFFNSNVYVSLTQQIKNKIMIHLITNQTKISKLKRIVKSGSGCFTGLIEKEYTVKNVCSTSFCNVEFEYAGSFYFCNIFKINGVEVKDGDVVNILQCETPSFNNIKIGDSYQSTIINYNDDYKEIENGKFNVIAI